MNAAHEVPEAPSTDGDEPLDPRAAASLLEQTQREARRRFTHQTPLLSLAQALVILAIYGAIWSSSRGQHPYKGPSLGVIGEVYILVAVTILVSVSLYVRATAGVGGRTRREERTLAIPLVASIVGVYVFDGALKYDGFSNAIVYGVFDAAAPWLVVGAVMAGIAAVQEDRWKLAGSVAAIVIGVAAAFAGPNNAWGVLAVGGCLVFVSQAVLRWRLSRVSP